MITESFLNSCFLLILNKNTTIKRSRALYRDVLDIITFTDKKDMVDVPISVKNKLDLLKIVTGMLMENNKSIDNIYDSVVFSEKFKQHKDYLDSMINDNVNRMVFQSTLEQVRLRKKIGALFKNYDELDKVLTSIKDGSFDSIDNLVDDYESTIKSLYSNMMESNRALTIEASASLDLMTDDYSHVVSMIKQKYDRTNSTPTGFEIFDKDILNGGYEPSRLYIFGGGSGAGKSTILNNTIYKSAMLPITNSTRFPKDRDINRVYVYVTLENTIEEALMRTYMPMYDKTIIQMLKEIGGENPVDIRGRIVEKLSSVGSTIIMKYFPGMTMSPLDLMGVLDEVIDTYSKECIAGLYVDYIDLLKPDTSYDMYRLELGHITLSLKTIAVQYNIPVITASQLGRSVYRITDSRELGVDQMSESIKKVEHADFVMLLAKDPITDGLVHGKVGKNRAGKANTAIDFNVDFERFKFDSAQEALANEKRPDTTQKACVSAENFNFDTSFKGMLSM